MISMEGLEYDYSDKYTNYEKLYTDLIFAHQLVGVIAI